jgi:hypothetical protein
MNIKTMLWVSMCVLMLTACGDRPEQAANSTAPKIQAKQADPIVDFQREVIPVLEDALNKQFPKNDPDAFFDQADYYFENEDVNNLKVIFLVDKEDTKEMKALRKDLEEKLGDKVVFKKAKHNPKVLRDMTKEVADYVATFDHQGRSYGVGWDSKEEVIHIEAKLSDEQITELQHKFGADLLKITNEDPHIIAY